MPFIVFVEPKGESGRGRQGQGRGNIPLAVKVSFSINFRVGSAALEMAQLIALRTICLAHKKKVTMVFEFGA